MIIKPDPIQHIFYLFIVSYQYAYIDYKIYQFWNRLDTRCNGSLICYCVLGVSLWLFIFSGLYSAKQSDYRTIFRAKARRSRSAFLLAQVLMVHCICLLSCITSCSCLLQLFGQDKYNKVYLYTKNFVSDKKHRF